MLSKRERETIRMVALLYSILAVAMSALTLFSGHPERLPLVLLLAAACFTVGTTLGLCANRRWP